MAECFHATTCNVDHLGLNPSPASKFSKRPRTSGLFMARKQSPGNGFIKALVEKSASQATGETISEHSDNYPEAGMSRSNTIALLAQRVRCSHIKAKKGGGVYCDYILHRSKILIKTFNQIFIITMT